MKDLSIDLNARQHLWVIVGLQEGRAADIRIFSRLLEKLVQTETEKELIGLRVDEAGNMFWKPNPEGIPPVELQLEDGDAAKLKSVLENWPRFTARDHEWLQKVMAQL